MDINNILNEYDGLFGNTPLPEIENYLYNKICEAIKEGDTSGIITLLNEMIGLCRDTSQKEKALAYSGELKKLMDSLGMKDSKEYATSMQNIANAYRAFGLWDEAEDAFLKIEKAYEQFLEKPHYLWASLYNNFGLLYQENGNFENSVEILKKSLSVIECIENAEIKVAITKGNLANSLFGLGKMEEGYGYLKEALKTFEDDGGRDFHYGASLASMGDYFAYKNNWQDAVAYYKKSLVEILIHTGKNDFYYRVKEKYENAKNNIPAKKWVTNIEKSKAFYEEKGVKMIHDLFLEYEGKIAVGLVGEGSDCFGFDDEISADHDYGVGFCMWLSTEDYEKIGDSLQEEYNKIANNQGRLKERRGVFVIDDFYSKTTDEALLAEQVNGEVFRDDGGVFTKKREELLKYFDDEVWRKNLATYLHEFSQYGQANYGRMMARGDYVTAQMCIAKAMETGMDICYVLLKKYAPYYKWKKKGLEEIESIEDVLFILEELACTPCQKKAWEKKTYSSYEINKDDKCAILIETLARVILEKLKEQNLVKGNDSFLENHIEEVLSGGKALIDKIINLEFKQFDKVKNEGGRASCQDNFNTFSIMRKSQYLTWSDELLKSYYNDLLISEKTGWNLISEKYARMMKNTHPEEYKEFENVLPKRTREREVIMEEIIRIQVEWMEEFSEKYPFMAYNARVIHSKDDTRHNTSYETYLRGELGTYGEETFVLYGRFITELLKDGKNLAYETMKNTALLYGYKSVEDAEERMGKVWKT